VFCSIRRGSVDNPPRIVLLLHLLLDSVALDASFEGIFEGIDNILCKTEFGSLIRVIELIDCVPFRG
jgi:hypothetical protein